LSCKQTDGVSPDNNGSLLCGGWDIFDCNHIRVAYGHGTPGRSRNFLRKLHRSGVIDNIENNEAASPEPILSVRYQTFPETDACKFF